MRAAFFDLDKTVIAKSSLVAFGPEFHARGLLHRRTLVWAVLSQLLFIRFGADEEKLVKIRESVLQITKGWDHNEVKRLVAETINEVIEPLIYEEALELIDYHLAQGDEVWLVSMSPAEIVEPFAELLGITGAISSRAKLDEQGKFTGEMEFFAQGENKAVAIRELAQGARPRPLGIVRLLRLRDRHSHARECGPRLRREPRPPTGEGGARKSVAATELYAPGARPRPLEVAYTISPERHRDRRGGRSRPRHLPAPLERQ